MPIFSATWRKLALAVNYDKYKVYMANATCIYNYERNIMESTTGVGHGNCLCY